MLRLCSKSSRSYPGRPVRHAVRILTASDAATYRVIGQESAGVICRRRRNELHKSAEDSLRRRTEHRAGKEPQ